MPKFTPFDFEDMPENPLVDIGVDDGYVAFVVFKHRDTGEELSRHEKKCENRQQALYTARKAAQMIEKIFDVQGKTVHKQ